MNIKSQRLLTVAEVAEYLQLSEKTILKMVNQNAIPCAKIANQWRFSPLLLDEWIHSQMATITNNDLSRHIENEPLFSALSRLMNTENVLMNVKGEKSPQILSELAENAISTGLVLPRDRLLEKLQAREDMTSTAVGMGVALPHVRRPETIGVSEPRIIIAKSRSGVDFSAPDSRRVHWFFLLLTGGVTVHLRVMSALAKILKHKDSIQSLNKAGTAEEVIAFFMGVEQKGIVKTNINTNRPSEVGL